MSVDRNIAKAIALLRSVGAWKAGIIIDRKMVVRVTRRFYSKGGFDKRREELLVTSGPPNYHEREVIKGATRSFPLQYVKFRGLGAQRA